MNVSVTDAKAQLTELVRLAEAGEDVVLTRHGQPTVRLVVVRKTLTRAEKHAALEELMAEIGKLPPSPGPDAAHAADFLYGDDGMPV